MRTRHGHPSDSRGRWFRPVLTVLVVALLAAACGDDDGDGEAAEPAAGTLSSSGAPSEIPECLDFDDIYALVGPESTGFSSWADANDLAAEVGAGHAPYPDVPLDIFGPGEESGTFDSFVELVLEGTAGERGQDDPSPRPDYQSSPNDNVIIEGISGSSTSLGWVGYAFYAENRDAVRAFQIDGGSGCVEPTPDTIASGEYAISRPLFIYVNAAKATESPALAAFVDYYLSDEGIAAVPAAGYVELDAAALGQTRSAWESSGLARSGDTALSGSIAVSGSSTVEPITARVAEAFRGQEPGVDISVEGPGTGDGFQRFCAGETDISDASRPIKEAEAQACAEAGVEYIELLVAIDGLSVLTSR